MNSVLKLDGGLWWDLGAMTRVDVRALIVAGRAFTVAVDPERCARLWGHPWSVVACHPVIVGNVSAWACSALPTLALSPLGEATAAAGPEGPEADDGAACKPAPTLHSCATFTPHLSMSCSIVLPPPTAVAHPGTAPAPALGSEKSITSRRALP